MMLMMIVSILQRRGMFEVGFGDSEIGDAFVVFSAVFDDVRRRLGQVGRRKHVQDRRWIARETLLGGR